jgi:hypothetical protein
MSVGGLSVLDPFARVWCCGIWAAFIIYWTKHDDVMTTSSVVKFMMYMSRDGSSRSYDTLVHPFYTILSRGHFPHVN